MKLAEETVDGGYSGELTVTRAAGVPGLPEMVFVNSDIPSMGSLALSLEQAANLAGVLRRVASGHDAERLHLV